MRKITLHVGLWNTILCAQFYKQSSSQKFRVENEQLSTRCEGIYDIKSNKKITSPRRSGSLNNENLQRPRYVRLKWDIDKFKYEAWTKYRFK